MSKSLSAIFISDENAVDFAVRDVIDVVVDNVKIDDIEEMYLLDDATENYYLVSDLADYDNLRDIVQPSISKDGSLSLFDFDIQLKNGVSIYTHDNLTVEAEDKTQLFKFLDFIFREFHLDAQKCKEKLLAAPDEEVVL
ncbi:MAG: hypothetical protein Q4F97_00090 [Bacteroidales bacterium]|nr:hypothetical protein [Bacteroidales bacterium]